jgi:hypothetical protein
VIKQVLPAGSDLPPVVSTARSANPEDVEIKWLIGFVFAKSSIPPVRQLDLCAQNHII